MPKITVGHRDPNYKPPEEPEETPAPPVKKPVAKKPPAKKKTVAKKK